MKITYEQIKGFDSYRTHEELKEARLDSGIELTVENLMLLETAQARWIVCKLMSRTKLISWVKACAERVKVYWKESSGVCEYEYRVCTAYALQARAAEDTRLERYAELAAEFACDAGEKALESGREEHRKAMQHAVDLIENK